MHTQSTSTGLQVFHPSHLMEAANDKQNLLTFQEWAKDPNNTRMPVVPEKVYAGRVIPRTQHLYREWERRDLFAKGEAPVACFGSAYVRCSEVKWHYSYKVLLRFLRKHKIFMFKRSHDEELRKYVHSKRRKPWHNFKDALSGFNAGMFGESAVVWVYGKHLNVTPERYEMIMWLHAEETRLRKLP